MTAQRNRRRPRLEPMEPRMAMNASLPADTLGVSEGVVPAPGVSGSASVTIQPLNLAQGRPSTVIGLAVAPEPGSTLRPTIVSAFGPAGERLPVYHQGSPGARLGGPSTILVLDDRPGPLTVEVAGTGRSSGAFQLRVYLPGDVNGSGHVDIADLQDLASSYGSKVGQSRYNPAADFLQTGVISQQDARLLERNLSNPTPNVPLGLDVHLAAGQQTSEPHLYNSGPITRKKSVTIIGSTLPGSAVFVDGPLGYYKFNGPLLPVNAEGIFTYKLTTGVKFDPNTNFLVVAPDGRQLVRNFPIITIGSTGSLRFEG